MLLLDLFLAFLCNSTLHVPYLSIVIAKLSFEGFHLVGYEPKAVL